MTTSADLGLPFISSQQATPEITHNEALTLLQATVLGVLAIGQNTPPVTPVAGDTYVLGGAPTGAWAGRANAVATYTSGGWRFLPDRNSAGTVITMGARQEGLRVWLNGANNSPPTDGYYRWTGSAWTQVGDVTLPSAYYGELDITNNASTQTLTAATDATLSTTSDYVNVANWDAIPHGLNYGFTQGSNILTAVHAGVYQLSSWVSIKFAGTNADLAFRFAKTSGGVTTFSGRKVWGRVASSTDKISLAGSSLLQLAAGDSVRLYVACTQSGALTVADATLYLHMIRAL